MLWSLLKIVLFVVLVTAAAFGVLYVIDQDGGLTVSLGGREYPFEPIEVLVLLVLAMIAFFILLKVAGLLIAVLRFLTGDETAISRFFDRNRERRGFNALAEAMMMQASGDGKTALVKARKADRLLSRPELTRLVTAQAAEEAGSRQEAEEQYKAMLEDPRTRFVGIHGLMRQRLAMGETETALKLAEKAFAIRPKHSGLQSTLFNLQTEQGQWAGARSTLSTQMRTAALPKDVANRRDAVLSLADARNLMAHGNIAEAKEPAVDANRIAPGFVPAAVTVAQVHTANGSPKAAQRALTKAWKMEPHPELAEALAELEAGESPAERRKRFEPLLRFHRDHPEARMLGAELAIADEDFPAARRALGDLTETHPTTRALALQAAIAKGEGAEDRDVRGLLTRALTAPRGPQWTCSNCRAVHARWEPVCPNCDSFDTVDWLDLPEATATHATSAAMLPVIHGMLEQADAPEAEEDADPQIVEEQAASAEDPAAETDGAREEPKAS
ncbi:heme biosynthesis protein HemY [Pontivivens insulae]|uniref:Lipopolysaccharide assembly protein B n=1 Tax=Pontivivens insulae TaxID=1639689 RepID=A0A2R8A8K9_9RHOB|nr:tetratricopeptide repeat protein [Pontivivens insulae]RED18669.1 HemY protein [Pontivivens insulae]SPF28567.1 Lipopolysaccharide assembly protein B [Pontivivens insulae]